MLKQLTDWQSALSKQGTEKEQDWWIPHGIHSQQQQGSFNDKSLFLIYTTLANFRTIYLVMCKVYTDVGGIKQLYHVCPSVRKIIHSLKLVDYLHVQADNASNNYYVIT